MDQVEVGGLPVAYRRAGQDAPPVLLHGGLADSREWRRQLEGLADDRGTTMRIPWSGLSMRDRP